MNPLLSISEAEHAILSSVTTATTQSVELEQAANRTLRQEILADRSVPPFDRVMMDGIALDSSEYLGLGTSLNIAGTQAAGVPALQKILPETCFEVMTGAPLPHGCDCVVPVEEISITGDSVILSPDAEVEAGAYIHQQGSDSEQGSTLLKPGTQLGAAELAIAASNGYCQPEVSQLPKICLITSGDEVIPPHQRPELFQIRSSHPIALKAMIEDTNLGHCQHLHLPDNQEATREALRQPIAEADFIVLTGGISKGKFDYIAPTLTELLGPALFHGVRQRPGKPMGYWKSHTGPAVFALPGNPVSVMASASRYLLPALRKHLGMPHTALPRTLAAPAPWNAAIPGFLPVKTTTAGTLIASPVRNSGDYLSLAGCSGFIQCPAGIHTIEQGTLVDYYPFQ